MCKILLESSFTQLYNNTKNNFTTSRDENSKRVQVTTTAFIPSLQNNSLEIRAKTNTDGKRYDSVIYFEDVEYLNDDNPSNYSISFMGPDNSEYRIVPISSNANVKVNCTCLDFHYRFATWNAAADSLYGTPPPPYVKKTNNKEANPSHTPGVCKHLIKLFDYIINQKIIK